MKLENKILKEEKKDIEEEYEIAQISKLEFMMYLTYWMGMLIFGCLSVYKLANRFKTLEYFKNNKLVTKTYFGLYQSNYEYVWKETKALIYKGFLPFTIYILISKFLRCKTSPTVFMSGSLILTIYFNYYYSSLKVVMLQIVILIIPSIAGIFRLKFLVWVSGIIMLYKMKDLHDLEFYNEKYIFNGLYPYIALLITRAISVGLSIADSPKCTFKFFLEMIFYYWYFPAIIGSRMMVVKDFITNIYKPYIIQYWKKWFLLAFRIIILFYIWDIVTTLVPFYLVFITHDIKSFDIFVVTGGQLYYGIHFCVIYIIIYNAVYLVTQLDGFLTAEGPECICHIALYNRMWKKFDVGMHLWIKENIFRPIIKLGNFNTTRIPAALASFGFVIIFHGLRTNTVLWISLNIVQFFVHCYLVHGFHNSSWGSFLRNNFTPAWNRHLIALVGAISWLMSIYGFGAFSYGIENNKIMYMTLFKNYSNPYYYRALAFGFFCYCHSQISLTVNDYLHKKKIL